jgi:pimeloyl-ACP methyl ester carboxylesterase
MTNVHRQRMLAGLPLTERRLRLGGGSTMVLEGGAGPPLVLLHGAIECGGVCWAPVLAHLAETHRLVVPDAPGLGESDPALRLDEAFGDWLAALLEATCLVQPALVAHSLLGTLVAREGASLAELLGRLVLYGAPGVSTYRLPLGLTLAASGNQERFERWAFRDRHDVSQQHAGWLEALRDYTLARGVVPHVERTMRQLIQNGTRPILDRDLRRIRVPTSLLWGRHDRMVPIRIAEVGSSRRGWPLHVVDGAGHVPHIEQPRSFVAALHMALDPSSEREAAA